MLCQALSHGRQKLDVRQGLVTRVATAVALSKATALSSLSRGSQLCYAWEFSSVPRNVKHGVGPSVFSCASGTPAPRKDL